MTKSGKLSAYILLDRSASMAGAKWESAIGSINSYIDTLKKEGVEAEVTIAAFDSAYERTEGPSQVNPNLINWNNAYATPRSQIVAQFDVIRDKKSLKSIKKLAVDELSPRGGTPLYDATAKMLNLADENNNEKTVIIIMTDGEENESKTYNITSIKDRISTCTHRGWEVIFLGAEFNATRQAMSYGLETTKVFNSTVNNMDATMRSYASASASYVTTGKAIDTSEMKID